jgi:EAL domain-containing protein (putative c-di-GMP-specific phosphodiesterase class I)
MRMIVLDDDEALAGFMATVASRRGWSVQTATRESEFQALVCAEPPDAIMLDLQLGVSDGIEQLHFLHQRGYSGAIVLMSGFDARVLASAQQIGDSLGLAIAAVVEKPARVERVRDVLAAIERDKWVHSRPLPANEVKPADAVPEAATIRAEDVARAIDAGEMELHLQPIVSAVDHEVTRAEALIRWRHPMLGPVAPERFVAIAEQDASVIDQLTMWVAATGVAHYLRLAELGSRIQICINISGRNLRAANFPDRMAALLEGMSAPPGAIGLEITESVAMHDLDATTATLTRLRLKGFPVAIDDFGTGHSSLTALRRMPFSTIKIDKSFVCDLQTSSDSLTIVRSVIQLAHDMRLASVAEGVDSSAVVRLLTEMGIDSLQGYYFSRPLPFDSFATWLREWAGNRVAVGV